ncbi:hypothetical protein EDD37DRAFT_623910 [Exophiala viscosa]|uniref:uncharacterized protein n=1 Tax=Exophiala viscosa TaxID=2486360 RepID=UPI0021A09092|nr:hypothetical protein EDD37DRAFT_623910 [Exophiala viscosa]
MSSMTSSLSTGSASSTGLASSVNSPSVPTSTQTSASGPSSTPVTSSTPTIAALAIGQDFPAGIVTSLPSGSNLILALANLNAQRMRVLRRQDSDSAAATAAVSAPPIAVVDLSPTNTLDASASAVPTGQNSVSEDNCDSASPLGLVNGSLLTGGSAAIAKPLGASSAALAPLAFNASVDQVNTGFSFDDGILQWNTDDVGEASFYSCDGVIWAGFPDPPTDAGTCEPVVVGAIGAQACAARIEADGGTVNPDLTAPVADDGDSSSTTSTVYTTTSVTITSALYTTLSTTSSLVQIFSISDSIVTVPPTPEPATTPVTTTSSLDTSLSTSASPSTSQTPSSGMITTSFTSISVTSSGYTGSNTTTMTSTSPMQASITTMTTTSTAPLVCNQDDCLRNVYDTRYYSMAMTFCPTFTMPSANQTLPTWLGNCGNDTEATSACDCLLASPTLSSNGTTSTTSAYFTTTSNPTSLTTATSSNNGSTTSTSMSATAPFAMSNSSSTTGGPTAGGTSFTTSSSSTSSYNTSSTSTTANSTSSSSSTLASTGTGSGSMATGTGSSGMKRDTSNRFYNTDLEALLKRRARLQPEMGEDDIER